MSPCRGSVLVFVLVMLAAMSMLGATLSRHASWRRLAAAEYRDGLCGPRPQSAGWQAGVTPCDYRTRREKRVAED
jgi:hypothetical protein